MQEMTLRWRNGSSGGDVDDFPSSNMVTFDYADDSALADGAMLMYEFQGLQPATVYVVRIEGRNRLGTSNSHFVIETGESS